MLEPIEKPIPQAYYEGRAALARGLSSLDCPYQISPAWTDWDSRLAWRCGWLDASVEGKRHEA